LSYPYDDPAVYAMLAAGDTLGVFQVESRAQSSVLPRLKPACLDDLVVAVSLIRPGPVQGQMVHLYLRRRAGTEPVTYLDPCLEPALRDSLGVLLFQEQVLLVAQAAAGWSLGRGELLRRVLGKGDVDATAALRAAFLADDVILRPRVAERVRAVLEGSAVLRVIGMLQRADGVQSILAWHVEPLWIPGSAVQPD